IRRMGNLASTFSNVSRKCSNPEERMTKAKIALPDGTRVEIEGTPEEVARLLEIYGGDNSNAAKESPTKRTPKTKNKTAKGADKNQDSKEVVGQEGVDLVKIIEAIRNCDEAEEIETEILDKPGQVNRILL